MSIAHVQKLFRDNCLVEFLSAIDADKKFHISTFGLGDNYRLKTDLCYYAFH